MKLYYDKTIPGCEQYVIADKDPNMEIPKTLRDCVLFLSYENKAVIPAKKEYCGTAYYICKCMGDKVGFHHLVTARHTIEGLRRKGAEEIFVHTISGDDDEQKIVKTSLNDWEVSSDPTVDAARYKQSHLMPHKGEIHTRAFATDELINEGKIALANDVVVTGLFSFVTGIDRIEPIIRVGNIAMLPRDRIPSEYGKMEAYIAEVRSISGLSGSPVFVIDQSMFMQGDRPMKNNKFYFLGHIHGHWNEETGEAKPDSCLTSAPMSQI